MTQLISTKPRIVKIEAEDDAICELCGDVSETRPYGPNGEEVCFTCGMKDEESAAKAFRKLLGGVRAT